MEQLLSVPKVNENTLSHYIALLASRRSRRFAKGLKLDGGPLTYSSAKAIQPLTPEEVAILAFAGAGVTGYLAGELPYKSGKEPASGDGNVMYSLIGRTSASADGHNNCTLFVMNDSGTWMLKRPQNFLKSEIPALLELVKKRDMLGLFDKMAVRLDTKRRDVAEREVPFILPFNKWSANRPGTTYFVPVNELSSVYITVLFFIFGLETGYNVLDDRNGYKSPGIGKFTKSKGGWLNDDIKAGKTFTLSFIETYICEMVAVEQGLMHQNLMLAAEALNLGAFPHYAGHPFAWSKALGFRHQDMKLSEIMAKGKIAATVMDLIGINQSIPVPIGLENGGEVLLKPYSPPYYKNMRQAVEAYVAFKYSKENGTFRDGSNYNAWKNSTEIQEGIPEYAEETIDAVVSYLEYLYDRYGRIPANFGPFKTILAQQVHKIDTDFYDRYYKPGIYEERHDIQK
jgi:hypothetical protein